MKTTSPSDFDPQPHQCPLPGDVLARYWIELRDDNPELVAQFRPMTVSFLAFDKDKSVTSQTIVGTGFMIGANPELGLGIAITAKHVFDGVCAVQKPRMSYVPSTPPEFVPRSATELSLDPEKFKVLWMGSKSGSMLNGGAVNYNESVDLACCLVAPQEDDSPAFEPTIALIDVGTPNVGDIVHMVSIAQQNATEVTPPRNRTGEGQLININRLLSIRRGTVTGVHRKGFGQYRWPCFTTSIPAPAGMSGGLVYVPRNGESVAACGVVCAEMEHGKGEDDPLQCGSSVIGCLWPALGLTLPVGDDANSNPTLLELIRDGRMPTPVGDINHYTIRRMQAGHVRLYFPPER